MDTKPETIKKQIIAVDIDDVLSPLHDLLFAHHNNLYGTNFPLRDPNGSYFLHDYTKESKEVILEKIEAFVQTEAFRNIKPLEYAVNAINQLTKKYELIIVTSRQDFYYEATHRWLKEHFPLVFSKVHFTEYVPGKGMAVPKSQICLDNGAEFIIDDSLDTAIECAEKGLFVLLFGDYPWNSAKSLPKGITRVHDWTAVLDYFYG